jgi:hypothetical protein
MECAFFLDDGNVIDQPNIFLNLGVLDTASAHTYFRGHCIEGKEACSCVYRMITQSVRKSLGDPSEGLMDHHYHHRFIADYPDEEIDWSSSRARKIPDEKPVQYCNMAEIHEKKPQANKERHIPENWPEGVAFCPYLKFRAIGHYNKNKQDPYCIPNIEIRRIDDPGHPCYDEKNPQYGVFALIGVRPGHKFGPYTGEVIPRKQFLKETHNDPHKYHMNFGRSDDFVIDADKSGNELRFVNDYRNITNEPNVEFVMKDWKKGGPISCVLTAIGTISAGDELVCDYGEDYWETQRKGAPTIKRCRSPTSSSLSYHRFESENEEGEELNNSSGRSAAVNRRKKRMMISRSSFLIEQEEESDSNMEESSDEDSSDELYLPHLDSP